MLSRDDIYQQLKAHLEEMFEVPPDIISREARLVDDLDLDSIDLVDLSVKLQELTDRKFSKEQFKGIRTVDDIVDRVHEVLLA